MPRPKLCPYCNHVISSRRKHYPRCRASSGLEWSDLVAMGPLPAHEWHLTEEDRHLAVQLLAIVHPPPSSTRTDVESMVLHWGHGYWRPELAQLVIRNTYTATLGLDTTRLDELDTPEQDRAALAVLRFAAFIEDADWSDDLDPEGLAYGLAAFRSLADADPARLRDEDESADSAEAAALRERIAALEAEVDVLLKGVKTLLSQAQPQQAPRTGSTWSDDDARRLLDLYRDGETLTTIAGALGRTPQAVVARIGKFLDLARPGDAFDSDGFPRFEDLDIPADRAGRDPDDDNEPEHSDGGW